MTTLVELTYISDTTRLVSRSVSVTVYPRMIPFLFSGGGGLQDKDMV